MSAYQDQNDNNILKIIEGSTHLFVPTRSMSEKNPPRSPAFFNPMAKISRDISVLIYNAFTYSHKEEYEFADVMSGVGARGLRVAKEVNQVKKVYINDLNSKAIEIAKRSAKINRISKKCKFSSEDYCLFLGKHSAPKARFDIIDLDPFGSPAQYIDSALRSIKDQGLISVTATDTAVLCGVHPKVSLRKYGGKSIRCEYSHELAIRLILGSIARSSMKIDAGITPLFVHNTRHYVRVFISFQTGVPMADENLGSLGNIAHCRMCGYREWTDINVKCPNCDNNLVIAGPLWIGRIFSKNFLKTVKAYLGTTKAFSDNICRWIDGAEAECDLPPTYYVVDTVSDRLNIMSPSPSKVVTNLIQSGFKASRTILNFKGVRTNASIKDFEKAIIEVNSVCKST